MGKKKYLVNGFAYLVTKNLRPYLDYDFIENFPQESKFDIITNFFTFFSGKIFGKIKKMDVVHINTWENFLNAKKYKNQVLIGESHGFHFGLNFQDTLKHFHGFKKVIAAIVECLLGWFIRYKIKKFDIYYVSTPNMLEFAKKIRTDAQWLPNAINIDIFNPNGKKASLKGNPVIFYPTRLHSFKNPKFGIDLFKKIKEQFPEATLHLIKYPNGGDALATYYEKVLTDTSTYIWHNFKTKEELAEMYRASDIVLGHFHETLGMMSLVELEATACGTAVISYDKYEIKTDLSKLHDITFEILKNKQAYDLFIKNNMEIVLKNHHPINIAKTLQRDIDFCKEQIQFVTMTLQNGKKYLDNLIEIDSENFSDVGIRGEKEFLFNYENKFEVSKLVILNDKCIGFIIGTSKGSYGYINRIAISKQYSGYGIGTKLLSTFSDSLKYLYGVTCLELVTHDGLDVSKYYIKNGFQLIENDSEIESFLIRKGKISEFPNYIGGNKEMLIFNKIL